MSSSVRARNSLGHVDKATFSQLMMLKYMRALAGAGEAVGVLAAQSVGASEVWQSFYVTASLNWMCLLVDFAQLLGAHLSIIIMDVWVNQFLKSSLQTSLSGDICQYIHVILEPCNHFFLMNVL